MGGRGNTLHTKKRLKLEDRIYGKSYYFMVVAEIVKTLMFEPSLSIILPNKKFGRERAHKFLLNEFWMIISVSRMTLTHPCIIVKYTAYGASKNDK